MCNTCRCRPSTLKCPTCFAGLGRSSSRCSITHCASPCTHTMSWPHGCGQPAIAARCLLPCSCQASTRRPPGRTRSHQHSGDRHVSVHMTQALQAVAWSVACHGMSQMRRAGRAPLLIIHVDPILAYGMCMTVRHVTVVRHSCHSSAMEEKSTPTCCCVQVPCVGHWCGLWRVCEAGALQLVR